MLVALISDIHANLPALEAVWADVRRHQVDLILCLGDVLGYGAFPNECADLMRDEGVRCLAGNHDLALIDWLDASSYPPDAVAALAWQRETLSAGNRAWIERLETRAEVDGFVASHGSPCRPMAFEYVLGLEGAQRLVRRRSELPAVAFIGHSHLTKAFVIHPDRAFELQSETICLASDTRAVVTVGSVGQPRDRNSDAAWVLYDTEARLCRYRRVAYDVRRAAQAIRARRLPSFLAERLLHGL